MKLAFKFSARGPDRVSDALATVLSTKGSWEFRPLFDLVYANLRSKDYARGGDELLRLRAHEKLQNFLFAGIVTKNGKEYSGVPQALATYVKTSAEFNARFVSGTHTHTPLKTSTAVTIPAPVVKERKRKPSVRRMSEERSATVNCPS